MKLASGDVKTCIKILLHIFKKIEEKHEYRMRNEKHKKTQNEASKDENAIYGMKIH